jgi:photosystem II stability/assembly factor-like uncharacterized protein
MLDFRGIPSPSLRWVRQWLVPLATLCLISSCAAPPVRGADGSPLQTIATESPRKRKGFGPPPPGHPRIVGEAVPKSVLDGTSQLAPGSSLAWSFIGPRPLAGDYWAGGGSSGGRFVGIACHPTNPSVAYGASASGGIWKTTDAGVSWTPVSDQAPILNHGAIALDKDHPDVIWAGTGEYTVDSNGAGVLRSRDGGQTWEQLGAAAFGTAQCSGIAVVSSKDPLVPAAVHWTGSLGYRVSRDGGQTWTPGSSVSGDCSSLAVHPTDPNIVYVARYGNGIYKSTNAGATFLKLSGGLPTTGLNRIVLAIAPSEPSTLLALFIKSNGGLLGLYRTTDAGTSWALIPGVPDFPYPQGWYDASISIDPANPNHYFGGGVDTYSVAGIVESNDAGATWTNISSSGGRIHPDHHWTAWGADGIPWFAHDGGISRRVNGAWQNRSGNLGAVQIYAIDQHDTLSNTIVIGTQDAGSARKTNTSATFTQSVGGDGGFCETDPLTSSTSWATYVYLDVYRCFNTSSWTNITGPWSADTRDWISPIALDLSSPNTLYAGSNRVWRNTAAATGASWTAISTTSVASSGTISCIAPVPGMPGHLWVANSRGGVFRTTDEGATWLTARNPDSIAITALSPMPGNPSAAYITRRTTTGSRVLRTSNGTTWQSVTGSLPSGLTTQCMAIDWARGVPGMVIGAGSGVYASFDDGVSWTRSGAPLPNVNTSQLQIDAGDRTVLLATYGRGAWRSILPAVEDINVDGLVDGADLGFILSQWGSCSMPFGCPSDLNGDGEVDGGDLGIMLSAFGT